MILWDIHTEERDVGLWSQLMTPSSTLDAQQEKRAQHFDCTTLPNFFTVLVATG